MNNHKIIIGHLLKLCDTFEEIGIEAKFSFSKPGVNDFSKYYLSMKLDTVTVVNSKDENINHKMSDMYMHICIEFDQILVTNSFYFTKTSWKFEECMCGLYLHSHVYIANAQSGDFERNVTFRCCVGNVSPLSELSDSLYSTFSGRDIDDLKNYTDIQFKCDAYYYYESFKNYLTCESVDGGPHYLIASKIMSERPNFEWQIGTAMVINKISQISDKASILLDSYECPFPRESQIEDDEFYVKRMKLLYNLIDKHGILNMAELVIAIGVAFYQQVLYSTRNLSESIVNVKEIDGKYMELSGSISEAQVTQPFSNLKLSTEKFYKYITQNNDQVASLLNTREQRHLFDYKAVMQEFILIPTSSNDEEIIRMLSPRTVLRYLYYYLTYLNLYEQS